MELTLTAAQVVELAQRGNNAPGFQTRTLQYWTAEHVLIPTDPNATRHRRYPLSEAFIARACASLFDYGVGVSTLKFISEPLRQILAVPDRHGVKSPDDLGNLNAPLPESKQRLASAWCQLERARRGEADAFFVIQVLTKPSMPNAPKILWSVERDTSGIFASGTRTPACILLDWRTLMEGTE